jgi:hypothetical protein
MSAMSVLKKTSFGAMLLAATAVLSGCYYGPPRPRYAYGPGYYRPAYAAPAYGYRPYGYAPYGGATVTVGGGYRHW